VHLSGDLGASSAPSEQTPFSDDELRAVVDVAESRDLRVVCYARSATSVVRALKYGINIINLANYPDGEALAALEAAKDRAVVIPAIGVMGTLPRQAFSEANETFEPTVVIRYFNTSYVLAESGVGVAIVDPLSPLLSGRFNLAIRPFEPATQISASVVRSRKRQLSRAAEAFLREVRVVAGEINEKLVSRSLPRSSRASGVFAGEIIGRDKA